MRFQIFTLRDKLAGGLLGNGAGRPDLAVRMGVAGAHHFAAVFENLHVLNFVQGSQFAELTGPGADDLLDRADTHAGKSQIVARREAHHAADSGFAFGDQQAFILHIYAGQGRVFFECCEIILKDEGGFVLRVSNSTSPCIARTEVTSWVILWTVRLRDCLNRALPWTLGSMWGDQHPFVRQRIKAAVRLLIELQSFLSPYYSYGLKSSASNSEVACLKTIDVMPSRALWFSHN